MYQITQNVNSLAALIMSPSTCFFFTKARQGLPQFPFPVFRALTPQFSQPPLQSPKAFCSLHLSTQFRLLVTSGQSPFYFVDFFPKHFQKKRDKKMGQQQSKDELLYQQVNYGNIEGIKALRSDGAGLEVYYIHLYLYFWFCFSCVLMILSEIVQQVIGMH